MQPSWSHGSRRDGMHAGAVRGRGAEAMPPKAKCGAVVEEESLARQTDRQTATLGNARARHQGDPGDTAVGDERERTETRGPLSPVAGAVPRAPGTPAT